VRPTSVLMPPMTTATSVVSVVGPTPWSASAAMLPSARRRKIGSPPTTATSAPPNAVTAPYTRNGFATLSLLVACTNSRGALMVIAPWIRRKDTRKRPRHYNASVQCDEYGATRCDRAGPYRAVARSAMTLGVPSARSALLCSAVP
jgi:hypothetical protein